MGIYPPRRRVMWLAAVLVTSWLAPAATEAQQQPHHVIFAKVHSAALEGNLLGDSADRNVTVYLPPGYADKPEQRYPVLYLLHGYTGSNYLWTGGSYIPDGINIALIADELIQAGRIKPMIIVCPDTHNKYRGSWYSKSSVTGDWDSFLSRDLVAYVDKTYRTLPTKDSRGIAGHSMGGCGAIKLAMEHPDIFSATYGLCPAGIVLSESILTLDKERMVSLATRWSHVDFAAEEWPTQALIALAAALAPNPQAPPFFGDLPLSADGTRIATTWARWLEHDPYAMIETHRDNLLQLRGVRFDCGTADKLMDVNRLFAKALTDAGITHSFEEYDGDHVNRIAERLHDKVLPFFSETLKYE